MSRSVTFRRRLTVALVITLVAGVVYAVYALKVSEIRVTGVGTLDPTRIIDRSGLRGGERILWIRLSSVAHRLEQIPAVEEVRVERSFPATVVIDVRERTPVARAGDRAVDAHGRIFPSPVPDLPALEGASSDPSRKRSVDPASRRVLEAFASFPGSLRDRTARIVVGPPLLLILHDATEVRFGAHSDLERKARAAEAVLRTEEGRELEYVDVRSPSVPVSRRREPPTPAPTPPAEAEPAAPG